MHSKNTISIARYTPGDAASSFNLFLSYNRIHGREHFLNLKPLFEKINHKNCKGNISFDELKGIVKKGVYHSGFMTGSGLITNIGLCWILRNSTPKRKEFQVKILKDCLLFATVQGGFFGDNNHHYYDCFEACEYIKNQDAFQFKLERSLVNKLADEKPHH